VDADDTLPGVEKHHKVKGAVLPPHYKKIALLFLQGY